VATSTSSNPGSGLTRPVPNPMEAGEVRVQAPYQRLGRRPNISTPVNHHRDKGARVDLGEFRRARYCVHCYCGGPANSASNA
jgi:hypothetical protein